MFVLPMNTKSFSHTRGSVPTDNVEVTDDVAFFPHTWECTRLGFKQDDHPALFPTHVGVTLIMQFFLRMVAAFSTCVGVRAINFAP